MTDALPESAVTVSPTEVAAPPQPAARRGRGGRGRGPARPDAAAAPNATGSDAGSGTGAAAARPAPRVHPVLEQLAALYPHLFGAVFRPLKRGIYQDLLGAHADVLDKNGLKEALAQHTRSTRYLGSVAAGMPRHDLQGQPVEAMAPEHVHHAVLEVFRRRQGRTPEAQRAALRERAVQAMVDALEASGLTRAAYDERVRGRDDTANALLDEALAQASARAAREEALLRAFEASGQTPQAFADMYGLDPRQAPQTLARARHRREVVAAASAEAVAAPSAEA
ncbi:MAG: ProQ/FINO family protein [Burkholderiaceae bacterium]|nr:ProQ/FINO family protein [Burkholderiaceae bacterium]MDZ4145656.1 ProQ/FINO family protein [Burkholderiales bacterium]